MTNIELTKPIAGLLVITSLGILTYIFPDWKDAPLLLIGALIPLYIPFLQQIDHYRNRGARAQHLLDLFETYEYAGRDEQTSNKLGLLAREYINQTQNGLTIQFRPRLQKPMEIAPDLIGQLRDIESAVLVLLLDGYWHLFNYSTSLTRKDFALLANRAAKVPQYQKILLMRSLRGLGVPQQRLAELADRILCEHNQFIGVRLPEDSAEKALRSKLAATTNETVWYMSTTSQVSGASRKSLLENQDNIDTVRLLIVSPLIGSDQSLSSLDVEYDVPSFAIPQDQFLFQDIAGDRLRRIIKILSACKNAVESTHFKYEVYFYKFDYPDIKIVLLEKAGYAQVKVGGLRFANNLYRFGYEIVNSELVRDLRNILCEFNRTKTKPLALTSTAFYELTNSALMEYYFWGQRNKVDQVRYKNIASLLRPNFDAFGHLLIDKLAWLYQTSASVANSANLFYDVDIGVEYDNPTFPYLGPCKSSDGETFLQIDLNGERFHVSVGVIFFDQGRVLLARKANPYYQNRWSIVGGHVNTGESPSQAIAREIEEEIGLTGLSLRLLFHSREIRESCRHGIRRHRWYVFYCADRISLNTDQLDPQELSEVLWCDPSTITSMQLTDACASILKQAGICPNSA